MKPTFVLLAAGISSLVIGCASTGTPTEKVATSQAAIRGAREVGAGTVPQAALYLKLAEEELQSAKSLIASDENERASFVLSRAQVDAELALSLAREASTRAQAQKALQDVESMRQRVDRVGVRE